MGQVLHGSAMTTETVHRAIQARPKSLRSAARRFGQCYCISPTTVRKWRSRQTSTDALMDPGELRSGVLRRDRQTLPLRQLKAAESSPATLRGCLQPCLPPQEAAGPDTL
jgi:hypothetical protein